MSESTSASAGKYADYSREQLIAEINRLKKTKKYGLVWEHKTEQVIEDFKNGKQPYLKEVTDKRIEKAPNEPTNLIIEGDNFDALSILNYTHAGKVDVIYIDPPYNTGNKDFIYNDNYVDSEDEFRHSKWLSFMEPRLKLAKNLLKEDGVIFISIDDNEQAGLQYLCNSVFAEEARVADMIWQRKTGASDAKGIAIITEHILVYTRNKNRNLWNEIFTNNTGSYDRNRYRFADEYVENRGPYYADSLDRGGLRYSDSLNYSIECPDGTKTYPNGRRTFANDGWTWKWGKAKVKWGIENGFITFKRSKNKDSGWTVQYKNYMYVDNEGNPIQRAAPFKNLIIDILNANGAAEQKRIFGDTRVFSNPKPVELIRFLIHLVRDNGVILDFFAGSGTTGHAVLDLNKEDGGHRQFILCTNNGDKGPDSTKIAEDITYPRIKTVITGKRQDGSKYSDGIPANLRYYKIGHLEKRQSVDAYRQMLVDKMENILQVKENAFEEIETKADYAFYQNSDKILGLVYESFELDKVIERLEKINENKKDAILYVFSYSRDALSEDYDLGFKVEFKAMPEGLLKTYLNILEELRKEDE